MDIDAVAKVAAETNTALEISASRHAFLTTEDILIAKEYDVVFTVNSDAHMTKNIGNLEGGLNRAIEAGLSIDTLLNNQIVGGRQ